MLTKYVNNNVNNKNIPDFNWNFNLKFINYGEKPAFYSKLTYDSVNYIDEFLDKIEDLDYDEENSKKLYIEN